MGILEQNKITTPIQKLYNIETENNFYIKRDDLLPFAFGGNKSRKALYFFKELLSDDFDTVVTYGAGSSNHCRVVANLAKAYGLNCYIVSPQEDYIHTYNSNLVELFDAKIIMTPLNKVSDSIKKLMNELSSFCKPYFIQGGGHGNLGTKAYVDAYGEICDYEKNNNISFDYIFHASGTGTTQAGLVVGQIQNKNKFQKIIGISVARNKQRGKSVIEDSLRDFLKSDSIDLSYVNFVDDYICGGYGKYNDEVIKTVKSVLCSNGIALNTTYSGKAFYGMIEYLKKFHIKNKNILFINTGGVPLFFNDLDSIKHKVDNIPCEVDHK